jgi:galactokinase
MIRLVHIGRVDEMTDPSVPIGSPSSPALGTSVHTEFARRFGTAPGGVWSAPGRVNLIGEHTDYNGGWVLPFAIALRTYAAAARRTDDTDDTVRVFSGTTGQSAEFPVATQPGEVGGWAAYVAGVVWSLRCSGYDVAGADLVVDGELPLGAGLSSSAALECAVAMALAGLAELDLDPAEVARLGQRAENGYVGVPSGGMDQLAAVHGRPDHLLLIDMREPVVEQVPAAFAAAGLSLLLVDTTVRHQLADSGYATRRAQCEEAAATLGVPQLRDVDEAQVDRLGDPVLRRRARHVVTENNRVQDAVRLLRGGQGGLDTAAAGALGALLTASHRSLRDDFEISVDELDLAVDVALAHGALGARLTGGGFGGCVLALVPAELVSSVSTACQDAFATAGWASPHCFEVTPAGGARRESLDP